MYAKPTDESSELIAARKLSELKSYEGKKIYQGDVTPIGEDVSKYYYIRYAADVDGNHKITHVTFSKDDKKLVVQSSNQDKKENLVSYDEVHLQKNYLGTIKVDKDTLDACYGDNSDIKKSNKEFHRVEKHFGWVMKCVDTYGRSFLDSNSSLKGKTILNAAVLNTPLNSISNSPVLSTSSSPPSLSSQPLNPIAKSKIKVSIKIHLLIFFRFCSCH